MKFSRHVYFPSLRDAHLALNSTSLQEFCILTYFNTAFLWQCFFNLSLNLVNWLYQRYKDTLLCNNVKINKSQRSEQCASNIILLNFRETHCSGHFNFAKITCRENLTWGKSSASVHNARFSINYSSILGKKQPPNLYDAVWRVCSFIFVSSKKTKVNWLFCLTLIK